MKNEVVAHVDRHKMKSVQNVLFRDSFCLSFRIQKVIAIISISPGLLRSLLITNKRKSIKENCRDNYPIDESAFIRNKIVGGDETANVAGSGEICMRAYFLLEVCSRQRNAIERSCDTAFTGRRLREGHAIFPSLYRRISAETALRGIARENDWR